MKIVSKNNKSDIVGFYHSYILNQAGEYKKSRSLLTENKESIPDVDFYIGLTFLAENKLDDAIQHWLLIPTASSLYFKSQINTALTYEKMNNLEKMKEILSALKSPPEYTDLIKRKIASQNDSDKNQSKSEKSNYLTYHTDWNISAL